MKFEIAFEPGGEETKTIQGIPVKVNDCGRAYVGNEEIPLSKTKFVSIGGLKFRALSRKGDKARVEVCFPQSRLSMKERRRQRRQPYKN